MLLANLFGLILLLGIFVITIDTSKCNQKHEKCNCHCCTKSETEKVPEQHPTLSSKITTTTTKKSPNTMSKPQTAKSTSKSTTNPTSKKSTITLPTKKITIPSKMNSTLTRHNTTLNSKITTTKPPKTMSKPNPMGSTSKSTTKPTNKKSTITLPKQTKVMSKDEKHSTKKTSIPSQLKSTYAPSKSATKKSTGTTISNGPCDSKKCMAMSNHYCICGLPNTPTNSSVPSNGSCQDIGCADGGKYCYCNMFGKKGGVCQCFNYSAPCDQNECKYGYDHQACYCFMGSAEPQKYQLPASKNCRDLLNQIGFGDGKNYCAMSVCNCDQFSQCTCNPPKHRVGKGAFNGFPPNTTTKCSIENCDKQVSEYCQCNCINLPKCQNKFVQMVNLTSTSKICDGCLTNYNCINDGQKCKCANDGSCKCAKVDPLIPINVPCAQCASNSNKTCICNFKDLRIQLNCQAKQCSSLANANKGDIPLDSCPYQVGQDCKCEYNTNYKQNVCYCRNLDLFQNITSLVKRQDPNTKCAHDDECSAYTDLYCVCSNFINYSYVKKHTYQKSEAIETACKSLQAKDIVCTAVGYLSLCFGTRCALSPINLYNGTMDQNQGDDF